MVFKTFSFCVFVRFEKNSSLDSTNRLLDFETKAKRLEAEVQIEMNLKNREYNALQQMADSIIDLSKGDGPARGKMKPPDQNRIDYEIMKADVKKKMDEVNKKWNHLKNLKCLRLEKKSKLTSTMKDLLKRMNDIKEWLTVIEGKLEEPYTVEKCSKKCIDKLLKEHEVVQTEIENQSGNVGEVLNLCELFVNDTPAEANGIDTNELESLQKALEKRWKAVCLSSTEKKSRIIGIWELLLQLSKICKEQEKWIEERENSLKKLNSQLKNIKINDIPQFLTLVENEKQELESKAPALKILDASYSKLAQESRLSPDNIKQLAGSAKTLIIKWHDLHKDLKDIMGKTSKINRIRDNFIKNYKNSIALLTNISAKLIQAELIQNPKKKMKKVNELEKELEKENVCLRKADETGLELMKLFPEEQQNISVTQMMIDEYQIMWKDLRERFADVRLVPYKK